MRTKDQNQEFKWRKLVIGDALSLNRLKQDELRLLLSYPYRLYVLPQILDQLSEDAFRLLWNAEGKARLVICYLNSAEKIKANMQTKQLLGQSDNYALYLARRLKAPMLVGDEYWRLHAGNLQDVKFIHTDRGGVMAIRQKNNVSAKRELKPRFMAVEPKNTPERW